MFFTLEEILPCLLKTIIIFNPEFQPHKLIYENKSSCSCEDIYLKMFIVASLRKTKPKKKKRIFFNREINLYCYNSKICIYFCITNFQKFRGFKKRPNYYLVVLWVRNWHTSLQHPVATKLSSRNGNSLEAW